MPLRDALVEVDMDQHTSRASDLPQPLRAVVSGLRHLPGAEQVGRVAGGTLDAIGAVSPRGRRMAVYAGAGVLGVAGVVEWPVALTGAAVAWLTQPHPGQRQDGEPGAPSPAGADGQGDERAEIGTRSDRAPAETPAGPGDRLTPSRHRPGQAEHPVHEQPAKVGDTATASALKQVAEATTHHGSHPGPHPDRDGAPGQPRDSRPTR
ncbi:hypothetical protein FHS32_006855 [Streptomyces albaduncus]|uniref:Uncharacterized protein n=2 Tax=Streptomyces griseoloalbus TaxID=67303 RepID=A0A7W8BUU9_9ACTN|nr:hypothetical protein [Streptomyces albaduncus]GGW47569.1 hypothetical protein GCM10010340_27220 [Streptomyces albaduncus]